MLVTACSLRLPLKFNQSTMIGHAYSVNLHVPSPVGLGFVLSRYLTLQTLETFQMDWAHGVERSSIRSSMRVQINGLLPLINVIEQCKMHCTHLQRSSKASKGSVIHPFFWTQRRLHVRYVAS